MRLTKVILQSQRKIQTENDMDGITIIEVNPELDAGSHMWGLQNCYGFSWTAPLIHWTFQTQNETIKRKWPKTGQSEITKTSEMAETNKKETTETNSSETTGRTKTNPEK